MKAKLMSSTCWTSLVATLLLLAPLSAYAAGGSTSGVGNDSSGPPGSGQNAGDVGGSGGGVGTAGSTYSPLSGQYGIGAPHASAE
jgi:hypothetical protein